MKRIIDEKHVQRWEVYHAYLKDFLKYHKPEQFDMREFVRVEPGCGTVCCLAGVAGMVPKFRAEGLMTRTADEGPDVGNYVEYTGPLNTDDDDDARPYSSDDAAGYFLGMDDDEITDLFLGAGFDVGLKAITLDMAAAKVGEMLAERRRLLAQVSKGS